MSEDGFAGMSPRDRWLRCNPDKKPEDWSRLIREGRERRELAMIDGRTYMTEEKRKADQRERQRRCRKRKKDRDMSDKEIRHILVIVTPDGRRHGQHLTDDEAVELCRSLLEIRGQLKPEGSSEPKPKPKHSAKKHKGRGARRSPGAGRKPAHLEGPEMSRIIAMRQEGMSVTAIAEATHHGIKLIRRELERMGGA